MVLTHDCSYLCSIPNASDMKKSNEMEYLRPAFYTAVPQNFSFLEIHLILGMLFHYRLIELRFFQEMEGYIDAKIETFADFISLTKTYSSK